MKLFFQNKKIGNLLSEGRCQRLPFHEKLLERLDQLKRAPDVRSVSQIAKCHRLQRSGKYGPDIMALNVTANWRLCFRVEDEHLVILDYCDYH